MFDPISIMLITAGLGFGAGVACALFWDEIKSVLQKIKSVIIRALEKIGELILHAISLTLAIITAAIVAGKFLMKVRQFFYSEKQKKWLEIIETSSVNPSDVPEHLLNKVISQNNEVDISEDIRNELSLEY